MNNVPEGCRLCPRECGAVRSNGEKGFCAMGPDPVIARAAPHFWEEPCISGSKGSGAVFFSGCSLGCVYCQNYEISHGGKGTEVSPGRLREIFRELEQKGVHNLNLITASHFIDAVIKALDPAPCVPVIWNTGGYESVSSLRRLEGKVNVYMPDMKYMDKGLAGRYSAAPDYPETAMAAIREMFRQTGPFKLDADGMLTRGVLIRHLVLPGCIENSIAVLDWIRGEFSDGDVMISLMGQYVPAGKASEFPELSRRVTEEEYARAEKHLHALGLADGYIQELSAAEEKYIPDFQGEQEVTKC